jgi:sulfatase modifying factor 1
MSSPVDVPLFPPKARLGLLAFVLGGAIAGLTFRSWAMEHARTKPKLTPCFIVARMAILSPEPQSGTEPQETDTGEVVYLPPKADKAVRCSAMLGDAKKTQARLATLLAEQDPEARAKKYMTYMDAIPKDASGDAEASAWGLMAEAIFKTAPQTPAFKDDLKRAIDISECRFGGSACSTPQPVPIVTWGAAGVGILGLLGAIVGLVSGVLARRNAPLPAGPRKESSEDAPADGAEAEGEAAEGEAEPAADPAPSPEKEEKEEKKKKKKKSGLGPGAGAATMLVLVFLAACQAPPKPADAPPPRAEPPAAAPSPPAGDAEPPPPAPDAPLAPSTEPPPASNLPASQLLPKEAPPSGACPGDMILVEGDYCTEVDHQCLKSWFDKSNKKEVCEDFAPKATCTGAKVKKRFCIDRFAWPNVRGERPEVMNNFYQAQIKCAAVDKRICTESEWTMSCEGPEMKPFPYGWKRDPTKCNGDHLWDEPSMKKVGKRDPKELARLWRGVPNGAQPECISDYGVPDLPGNTDDIASSETYSSDYRGKFDSVTTGGPWYKGVRNQCRPKIYTHDEGFYYYNMGFRCCGEADGKPTDPRTPKQRKDDWKFSRVEGLGRFTIAQMKEKLREKKAGGCSCKDKDTLCKTMCGTLLGPGAKDADLKAPRE